MAKQADGAVVVRLGDTVVLATACSQREPRPGFDFLPLTVDYAYAGDALDIDEVTHRISLSVRF